MNNIVGYYVITDSGDGSASVRFFKHEDNALAYEEWAEKNDPDGRGSLSEGVVTLFEDDIEDSFIPEDDE